MAKVASELTPGGPGFKVVGADQIRETSDALVMKGNERTKLGIMASSSGNLRERNKAWFEATAKASWPAGTSVLFDGRCKTGLKINAGVTGNLGGLLFRGWNKPPPEIATILATAGATVRPRLVGDDVGGFVANTVFAAAVGSVVRSGSTVDTGTFVSRSAPAGVATFETDITLQPGDTDWCVKINCGTQTGPQGADRTFNTTHAEWEIVNMGTGYKGLSATDVMFLNNVLTQQKLETNFTPFSSPYRRSVSFSRELGGGATAFNNVDGLPCGYALASGQHASGTILYLDTYLSVEAKDILPGKELNLYVLVDTSVGFDDAIANSAKPLLNGAGYDVNGNVLSVTRSINLAQNLTETLRLYKITIPNPPANLYRLYMYFQVASSTAATADYTFAVARRGYHLTISSANDNFVGADPANLLLRDTIKRREEDEDRHDLFVVKKGAITSRLFAPSGTDISNDVTAPGALTDIAVNRTAGVQLETATYTCLNSSLGSVSPGVQKMPVGGVVRGRGIDKTRVEHYQPTGLTQNEVEFRQGFHCQIGGTFSDFGSYSRNVRYNFHREGYFRDAPLNFLRVKAVHEGNDPSYNWKTAAPLGIGTSSGFILNMEDSHFESIQSAALVGHNNPQFGGGLYRDPEKFLISGSTLLSRSNAQWGATISWDFNGAGQKAEWHVRYTQISGGCMLMRARKTQWITGDPTYQPANHIEARWRIEGCSPFIFDAQDFGRALRISSASTTAGSDITLDTGTSAFVALFGSATKVLGGGGEATYQYGYNDIFELSNGGGVTNSLAARLGNRVSSPWALTGSVNGSTGTLVTLDQNFTGMTNRQILDFINTASGGAITADMYAVGEEEFPSVIGLEEWFYNARATDIPHRAVIAHDTEVSGATDYTIRLMASTDDRRRWRGIALERVPAGKWGRCLRPNWCMPLHRILRSDAMSGATFTASLAPGAEGVSTLTLSGAPSSGALSIGQRIVGPNVGPRTYIVSGAGTSWTVTGEQVVASVGMFAGTPVSAYDVFSIDPANPGYLIKGGTQALMIARNAREVDMPFAA